MQLLKQAHPFEYRDHHGIDRLALMDVWIGNQGKQARLVLHGLPETEGASQAEKALETLSFTCLPYLLPPDVQLEVMVVYPTTEASKTRKFILPLSA